MFVNTVTLDMARDTGWFGTMVDRQRTQASVGIGQTAMPGLGVMAMWSFWAKALGTFSRLLDLGPSWQKLGGGEWAQGGAMLPRSFRSPSVKQSLQDRTDIWRNVTI